MKQGGFTLIEILVAVAIFGMLSIGAYTVIDAGIRTKAQSEVKLAKLQRLQRAIQVIEKDILLLSPREVRNEFGDHVPSLTGEGDITGQIGSLALTRSNWRNPAQLPRSSLQRVEYKFEQGVLSRQHSIFLDQASNSTKINRNLLEEVDSFKIAFMDSNNEWQTAWGKFTTTDVVWSYPKAIKITLELKPFGEIERIIEISLSELKSPGDNQT